MSEWIEKRKIKDIVLYEKGKAPSNVVNDDLVPYLSPDYLRGKTQPVFVCNQPNFVWVEDGDIILLWDGSNAGEFFRAKRGVLASTMSRLLFEKQTINADFLLHYFKGIEPQLKAKTSGTGIPHVDKQILGEFIIRDVSPAEQTRIALILSTVDAAIEQTETLIAKYNRIRTGLMKDLLTCGIDRQGRIRTEATHAFKDSPLGRVPVEWEVVGLKAIGETKTPYLKTGPFGSSLKISDWVDDGVPVITIGSLGENDFIEKELLQVSQTKAEELSGYRLNTGDLVFSRVADVGRSLVVKNLQAGWIMSSNFMRIRLNSNLYSPDFLHLIVKYSETLRIQQSQFVNSSGRTVINSSILNSFLFPKPSLYEQSAILEKIKKLYIVSTNANLGLSKLQTVKKGLMQDLLAGPGES